MIKLFSKFIYCIHCKNLCTVSMLWVTCLGSRIYLPFRSVVFHVYKVFHVFHLYKDWGVGEDLDGPTSRPKFVKLEIAVIHGSC